MNRRIYKGTREMNVNEIADALDEYNSDGMPVRSVGLASAMLRQQQAEIEALRNKLTNNLNNVQYIEPVCCNHNCNQGRNCPLRKINANKLAEEIIELECEKERQREKYEEMLCDRDVEIEKLKVEKIRAYDNGVEDGRKLDTNPKPAKTLTDDEIAKVSKDFYLSDYVPYDFARAILRKANEK